MIVLLGVGFGVGVGTFEGVGVGVEVFVGVGVGVFVGVGVGVGIGAGLTVIVVCTVLDCPYFPAGRCTPDSVVVPGATPTRVPFTIFAIAEFPVE